jgi:hypothetical protein
VNMGTSPKGYPLAGDPIGDPIVDSFVRSASMIPAQIRLWLASADEHAALLVRWRASPAIVTVFWIRLCGVLVELDEFLRPQSEPTMTRADPECSTVTREMHECIQDLRRALDRNLLIYAEYRRHAEAHPFQTGYQTLMSGGKVRQAFNSKVFGTPCEVPFDEVEAILDHVRSVSDEDEGDADIASLVATIVGARLARLHALARRYETRVLQLYAARGAPP